MSDSKQEKEKELEWPDLTGLEMDESPIPDEKERMETARADLLDFDEMKTCIMSDSAYIGERLVCLFVNFYIFGFFNFFFIYIGRCQMDDAGNVGLE